MLSLQFGAMPTDHIVSIGSKSSNNLQKVGPGAAKGQMFRFGAAASAAFWARRSQGPPRARGLRKTKTTEEQLAQDLIRHGPMAWQIFAFKAVMTDLRQVIADA